MLSRTEISVILIAVGPTILAAAVATLLFQKRRERCRGMSDAGKARLIVVAAAFATALATAGILLVGR